MKKLLTYVVLVTLTITVAAQTSRRQGSYSKKESGSTNNKTTEVRSSTSKRTESTTYSHGRSNPDNRNTENNYRKTSNNTNREANYNRNDHRSNSPETNHQVRKVEHRASGAYHSDRVYVSPRTYVRKVEYRSHNRPVRYVHTHVVREPARVNIVWDVHMHSDYCKIYPFVKVWRIPVGTHISTISAYDAYRYVGDVKRIYGYVREVYYEPHTDEYHLYIGDYFPYQDFTVIVPGYIARQISRRPYRYFTNQYIITTGYITQYDDRPEMLIKRNYQIEIY